MISPADVPDFGGAPQEEAFEFDDPFGDDDSIGGGEGPSQAETPSMSTFLDYGDQLVEQPKKVISTALKYAKTAKRVDVKKLKENIWKELIEIPDDVCVDCCFGCCIYCIFNL